MHPVSPSEYMPFPRRSNELERKPRAYPPPPYNKPSYSHSDESLEKQTPPRPPPHKEIPTPSTENPKPAPATLADVAPSSISYMKEFPRHPPLKPKKPPSMSEKRSDSDTSTRRADGQPGPRTVQANSSPTVPRKAVANKRRVAVAAEPENSSEESLDDAQHDADDEQSEWDARVKKIMKKLPKGVDELAAKQIFNEIVIQGDEVHWDDVAGLEIAKSALKETVVYPFLRPDLFMGLREPARGMLLFGPPGTGESYRVVVQR
jgi:fidgetin-like protein 1